MATISRHQARQAAIQALYQWDLTEQDSAVIEEHFIHQHEIPIPEKSYFHTLVEEVPLYHQEIDSNLGPCLDRELATIDPVERAILRLGAYELEYQHEVPTRVILNEAIELARTFGAEHSYKFVNAVLDKLCVLLRPEGDENLSPSPRPIARNNELHPVK